MFSYLSLLCQNYKCACLLSSPEALTEKGKEASLFLSVLLKAIWPHLSNKTLTGNVKLLLHRMTDLCVHEGPDKQKKEEDEI